MCVILPISLVNQVRDPSTSCPTVLFTFIFCTHDAFHEIAPLELFEFCP